jgi:hypothetical protein
MIFRLRFIQRGGHIHCRLFQATTPDHTWQKNGELVFDEPGWRSFCSVVWARIELIPEDATPAALIPDCDCRNPRCGHKASMHVGPGGACLEEGCQCGPGGWV